MKGLLLQSTLITALLCIATLGFASEAESPAQKAHQEHSSAGCMSCHQGTTDSTSVK